MSIAFHKLKVSDLRRETPDAVSIAFEVPQLLRESYRFQSGQHLTLKFNDGGKELRRSYSICAGMDDNELRIAVKKVDGGSVSSWVNDNLKVGDEIEVMTPQGRFGVAPQPDEERTYLAIAAGSGITPINSMIRTMLTREPQSRFILIYGNRNARSIMFKDKLEDMKDQFLDRLIVHHVLSREPQEIAMLSGRLDREKITSLLKSSAPNGNIAHAFLCGPGGLVKEGGEALRAAGLDPSRVHVEYFSTDGLPVAAKNPAAVLAENADVNASITLNGIQYDVPMKADETIVDAGLRAGLDMPFSCKGGMCCTCRAKLTGGDVVMEHNYSLEDWEMKAGFVLTCQARPTTKAVAVDFDQL
jgi:ring-1,2-phenylacetyl-CoA epoxidase subunit PaaE